MRSMFLKIFLWFWLVIAVVVGVLALAVWFSPEPPRLPRPAVGQLHRMQVRGALAARDALGHDAFLQYAQELEDITGLRSYWLDAAGNDIAGNAVPEGVSARARRAQRAPAQSVAQPGSRGGPGGPGQGPLVFNLVSATGDPVTVVSVPLGNEARGYAQPLVLPGVFALHMLCVVLAAGLGCYVLARYLTNPMRHLQQVSRRLAAGDFAARVGAPLVGRRDDVGELAREFDRMAGQVDALVSAQRRLLADVSHELRSPLARLRVALELVGQHTPAAAERALDRCTREAERLNELIGQLLALSRLEGGAPGVAFEPVDLDRMVRGIVADADFEARGGACTVTAARMVHCRVRGSAPMLQSAIENVVRNAVHYTAPDTVVEVNMDHAPRAGAGDGAGAVVITVRDHGPGLPDAELSHIFEPFYRANGGAQPPGPGAGLGLAIAQRAIHLHGGTIHAANAPGGGLLMTIELPVAG